MQSFNLIKECFFTPFITEMEKVLKMKCEEHTDEDIISPTRCIYKILKKATKLFKLFATNVGQNESKRIEKSLKLCIDIANYAMFLHRFLLAEYMLKDQEKEEKNV